MKLRETIWLALLFSVSVFASGTTSRQIDSIHNSSGGSSFTVPSSSAPAASSVSVWDASKNLSSNAMVQAYATTATAGSTTTLTVSSAPIQYFTGTSAQTIVLPVVSTLPQTGFTYSITNNSTGLLTVESSGGNLITTVPAGATGTYTSILLTGTTAASWNGVTVSNSYLNYPTFSVNSSTTSATTSSPFIYSNVLNDSGSSYNASTGIYTIPASHGGMWHFSVLNLTGTTNTITLNDGATIECYGVPPASSSSFSTLGCDIPVSAGDQIGIYPSANSTATGASYQNQFSGYQIITSQAQPIGNITSSGSGQYHSESLTFGGSTPGSACTGTCTISSSTGSWATVTRGSTGSYTITFASGEFSSSPTCMCRGNGASGGPEICTVSGGSVPSTTSTVLGTVADLTNASVDTSIAVMCMGSH